MCLNRLEKISELHMQMTASALAPFKGIQATKMFNKSGALSFISSIKQLHLNFLKFSLKEVLRKIESTLLEHIDFISYRRRLPSFFFKNLKVIGSLKQSSTRDFLLPRAIAFDICFRWGV